MRLLVKSLGLLGLLLLVPGCAAAQEPAGGGDLRWDGEFGLAVAQSGGRLEVRWITHEAQPGVVRALDAAGGVLQEARTRRGREHVARLRVPSGAFRLQYGSRGEGGQHETWIHPAPAPAPVEISEVDSLFVVGDVHGEYDRLLVLLGNAGVIDDAHRWAAGRAHLVLLGDLMDRGPEVTRLLWFIYGLERQAESAGGRVHVVLGNHEIMVFTSDDRYVHSKERMLAEAHGVPYATLFDIRESVLGRWLVTKPGMLRIGDILFAHGGVSSDYLSHSVTSFGDTLRSFMSEDLFYNWADESFPVTVDSAALARRNDFFWSERSVFWDRGYVQTDTRDAELSQVLEEFGSSIMVVAHTPQPSIAARYGGRVLAIHPREPALEMLLILRGEPERRIFRVPLIGPPQPL